MRRLLAILILLLPLAAIHAQDEVVNAMRHPISGGGGSFTLTTKTCSAQGTSTPSASIPCTWSTALASGDTPVCVVRQYTASGLTYSVTDSNSDTWSAIGTQQTVTDSGAKYIQMFFFPKITTSVTTSTFSLSTAEAYPGISCVAGTGDSGTPSVDTSAGPICTGTTGGTAQLSVSCSAALTPTASDLVVVAVQAGTYVPNLVTGFTAYSAWATNVVTGIGIFSSTVTPGATSFGSGSQDVAIVIAGALKP